MLGSLFKRRSRPDPSTDARGQGAVSLVNQLMAEVPAVVACGVADIETGVWLALDHHDDGSKQHLSSIAGSMRQIFLCEIPRTPSGEPGPDSLPPTSQNLVEEITICSTHNLCVFARIGDDSPMMVGAVTSHDAKLGLIVSSVRRGVKQLTQGT